VFVKDVDLELEAMHTFIFLNDDDDTIQYDSGYLTCSKKLTGSQLSLQHGINKKLKCETKNKMMSVIGPVQSRYHDDDEYTTSKQTTAWCCSIIYRHLYSPQMVVI